jgi:hypothetical protein
MVIVGKKKLPRVTVSCLFPCHQRHVSKIDYARERLSLSGTVGSTSIVHWIFLSEFIVAHRKIEKMARYLAMFTFLCFVAIARLLNHLYLSSLLNGRTL